MTLSLCAGDDEWLGQLQQDELLVCANVPATQLRQTMGEVAPTAVLYLPASQPSQIPVGVCVCPRA